MDTTVIDGACAELLVWAERHLAPLSISRPEPFFVSHGRVEPWEPQGIESTAHARMALVRAFADAADALQPILDRLSAAVPYLTSPRCRLRLSNDQPLEAKGPSLRVTILMDDARAGVDRTEVSTVLGRPSPSLAPLDRLLALLAPYPACDTLYTINLRSVVADTPENASALWWIIHRTSWIEGEPVANTPPEHVSVRIELPFGAEAAARATRATL